MYVRMRTCIYLGMYLRTYVRMYVCTYYVCMHVISAIPPDIEYRH